jgi:hypothetical protein
LGELEELINDQAPELKFQAFFEAHPEFLLALGEYGGLHSQLVVHEDQGGRFVPDFFLEKLDSGFADICDLKRANERLVRVQRRRTRFRDCVAEAIAQLDYYRNWFDDRGDSAAFRDRFGFSTYRPRVVVVIGRTQSYEDDIQRAQLESGLPGWVSLKTYDDILLRAKQWRELAL